MVGDMMKLQQSALQLRQVQQEWNARSRFGELAARAGGDIGQLLEAAQADPLIGAFAPQLMTELRAQRLLDYQVAGQQSLLSKNAQEALRDGLQVAGPDPTKLDQALLGQFSRFSKQTQIDTAPYLASIRQTLLDGLPEDPEAARGEYARRRALLMVSTKMQPNIETAMGAVGLPIPQMATIGGQPVSMLRHPITGQLSMAPGQEAPNQLAPPGQAIQGPVNPALEPTGPSAPTQPATTPTSVPPPAYEPTDITGAGTVLYPPNMRTPLTFGRSVTGAPILTPIQAQRAEKLNDTYVGDEAKQFRSAQQNRASFVQMDNAFDTLVQGGGFLVPGATARFRANIANLANTFADIAGADKPPFDPTKVATAQEFVKETERMALQVTNQFLGGQREAFQTINRIARSVPDIENTYLGGKLILSGLKQANQRIIEERNFKELWLNDPKHGGNLLGAEEAFNHYHKPEVYAERALAEFGLTSAGRFKDPKDIVNAVNRGLLTPQQGLKIKQEQFGNQ